MSAMTSHKSDAEKAADIVRHAGGTIIGRTRLQKIAYLLEITGLGDGFSFGYRHYGPFSEDLANALAEAQYSNLLSEEERSTWWGGSYSIFNATPVPPSAEIDSARKQLISLGVKANPISIELAATAAYLAREGDSDPWAETSRRKPEKANKLLDDAKRLYGQLRAVNTPTALPEI